MGWKSLHIHKMEKIKNKRGAAGLEVVEGVIFALLVIAIISIASILVFYSLLPSTDTISINSAVSTNVFNETTTSMNATGFYLSKYNIYGVSCSVGIVTNATDGALVGSGNYSVSNCFINASTATAPLLNKAWNVSYSYKYPNSGASSIINNISNANTSFFGNSNTFFSILAVVVIIALIALIVLYIRSFRMEGQKATA